MIPLTDACADTCLNYPDMSLPGRVGADTVQIEWRPCSENVIPEAMSGAHPRKRVAAGRHTVLTRLWSLTRRSAKGWLDHEGPRLAASLSFYSLLSLAPLVLLIIAIASLGVGRVAAQRAVISEFRGVNIFFAKPEDYRKATERVYHTAGKASFVELPIVPSS